MVLWLVGDTTVIRGIILPNSSLTVTRLRKSVHVLQYNPRQHMSLDPLVPLDNNRAERLLRIVALARKNFYGTYAEWSREFTAICLTILQTAVMHDLEPIAYIIWMGAPRPVECLKISNPIVELSELLPLQLGAWSPSKAGISGGR